MEDRLTCTICMGYLAYTVTLPCIHRFCLRCIDTWYSKSTASISPFMCPVCKDTTAVTNNWKRDALVDKCMRIHITSLTSDETGMVADWNVRMAADKDYTVVDVDADRYLRIVDTFNETMGHLEAMFN